MSRVAVIVNPVKVADAGALKTSIQRRCADAELGEPLWLETTADDPGAGMAREALGAGAELILVCGGDGTVAVCADTLAAETGERASVSMAVIPAGTGNLLARNLDLPMNTEAALDLAFGPERRELDVLDAGDRCYVVMAGLGFDAAMIQQTDEELKGRIGWLAYLGGIARAFEHTPRAWFDVEIDGQPATRRKGVGVLIGNVGRLQGGMVMFPDAVPDDGLLDVIVLAPHRVPHYLSLVWHLIRRRPERAEHAEVLRGSSVIVRADRPVPVEFDGDEDGTRRELSVRVRPNALKVCAPTK